MVVVFFHSAQEAPTRPSIARSMADGDGDSPVLSDDALLKLLRKKAAKVRATIAEEADRPIDTPEDAEESAKKLAKLKETHDELAGLVKPLGKKYVDVAEDLVKDAESLSVALESRERTKSVFDEVSKHLRRKVQVVFCFDGTSSMGMQKMITEVTRTARKISEKLAEATSLEVEVGYQIYRDYEDLYTEKVPRFEQFKLTPDVDKFAEALKTVQADGGGDLAEDVLGGLMQVATNFDWAEDHIRVCVWCGDAPGHGLGPAEFLKDKVNDKHPGGDPDGHTVSSVCQVLAEKQIKMAFLKLGRGADAAILEPMMEQFRSELTMRGVEMFEEDLDPDALGKVQDKMKDLIISASSSSLIDAESIERYVKSRKEKRAVPRRLHDPAAVPPLTTVPTLAIPGELLVRKTVAFQKKRGREQLKELMSAHTADDLELTPSPCPGGLLMERSYFACGGIRYAHFAACGRKRLVAKDFQAGPDELQRHVHELKSSLVAELLATWFCSSLELTPDRISVVRTQIFVNKAGDLPALDAEAVKEALPTDSPLRPEDLLSVAAAPEVVKYYSLEEYKDGPFIKFNSNGGYIAKAFADELPQAFTHFTFEITNHQLMVADLQGWVKKTPDGQLHYEITDPAVLTKDRKDLPSDVNVGRRGMLAFLRAHVCSDFCRKLKLPKYNLPPASAARPSRAAAAPPPPGAAAAP